MKLSESMLPKPIIWRLMIPLSVILFFIVLTSGIVLFKQHKKSLNTQLELMNDRMSDAFISEIKNLAESLEFALIAISSANSTRQYIKAGDKVSLYERWKPIYEKLKADFEVNHFTFMDNERNRILRVHLPDQSEGTVIRHTLLEAERTGEVKWGIELEMGSLEIPTLRVVQPIFDDNTIIGFVELGDDIDGLLEEIYERTDNHIIATVFKEKIDSVRWVETMKILNREADWGRLKDAAIFYTSLNETHNGVIDILNSKGIESIKNGLRVYFNNKIWQVSQTSILDASGKKIGYLIFMVDSTNIVHSFRKAVFFGSLIVLILVAVLISIVYFLLKRTNKLIIFQWQSNVESEGNYKELFNSVADSIVIYDFDGNIIDYNENAYQLYEYSRSELINIKPFDIVHPDYHSTARENLQRIMSGQTTLVESVHIKKSGICFAVEIKSLMINIKNKSVVLSVIRDISERKKQEELITRQSQQLEALKRTSTDGFCIVGSDGKLKAANKAYCEMSGYTEDELLQLSIASLEAREAPEEIVARIQKIRQQGWDRFESQHRRKDGTVYDVMVSLQLDSEMNESYGFIRDITCEKRVKKELEITLLKYKTLFHSFPLGITIADENGKIIECNTKAEELLGVSAKEQSMRKIIGEEWNIIRTDGTLMNQNEYASVRALKENRTIENIEMGIVKGTENITWINVSATPVEFDDRNVIITYGDISDKVKLQKDLLLKENAIQNTVTGIALSGNDGLISCVNSAFLKLWGYQTDQEVVGRSVFEFWQNPDDIVEITKSMADSQSWNGIRIAKRKDGSTFYCQISANFLSDASGNVTHFMGSFWDITEMKKLQETLKEREFQYRTLFEQSPYGVLLIDINTGQTVESNETAAWQLGYTVDEFQSIKVSDYEAIETPEDTFKRLKSIEKGQGWEFDTLHRTKGGKIINVRVSMQPIILRNQKYVFAIFQDITERVEHESLYNNILKTALDGFFISDLKGKIFEVNDSYCKMVGYSRDEMLNMRIFDIEASEDAEAIREHISVVLEKGRDRFESRHRHKNGDEIIVEINVISLNISGGVTIQVAI